MFVDADAWSEAKRRCKQRTLLAEVFKVNTRLTERFNLDLNSDAILFGSLKVHGPDKIRQLTICLFRLWVYLYHVNTKNSNTITYNK